jgi:hypothetical protein
MLVPCNDREKTYQRTHDQRAGGQPAQMQLAPLHLAHILTTSLLVFNARIMMPERAKTELEVGEESISWRHVFGNQSLMVS